MERNLKNIIVPQIAQAERYTSRRGGGGFNAPPRNYIEHESKLRFQLKKSIENAEQEQTLITDFFNYKDGLRIVFKSQPGFDLKLESLENKIKGIRLVNFKQTEDGECATVFIPHKARNFFLKKLDEYLDDTKVSKKDKRRNADLVNSIEEISNKIIRTYWTDSYSEMPAEGKQWCEFWLWYDHNENPRRQDKEVKDSLNNFYELCAKLNIAYREEHIIFPETVITMAEVNSVDVENLVQISNQISEIRKINKANSLYFYELTFSEQKKLINNFMENITVDIEKHSPAICLLDTGLCNFHPLVEPFVESEDVLNSVVKPRDNVKDLKGHGTQMAGIAIYNNLTQALESQKKTSVKHSIESVKILPDEGENEEELYGWVTSEAIYCAEINSLRKKVYCMAVSAIPNGSGIGLPTQWSASVDELASDSTYPRLILVSAGNIDPNDYEGQYPEHNKKHSIEDPAQAWNALSIGAYNASMPMPSTLPKNWEPTAPKEGISPYSTTSSKLDDGSRLIKPEILFDGGTTISNKSGDYSDDENFSLLTSASLDSQKYQPNYFSSIHGTSSATAQAANFAARLWETYPELWPESIRGLMVHSSEWTEEMRRQFLYDNKKATGISETLRTCGYGVPNFAKAAWSLENSVNMIVEENIQPFFYEDSRVKTNEMHYFQLPWPSDELESLENESVRLRFTLSYFVRPSPDLVGASSKYIYPSHRLAFEMQNSTETSEEFKKRINKLSSTEESSNDSDSNYVSASSPPKWYLGSNNRNQGSIHSDIMVTKAINLLDTNLIAVYPMAGWWKNRPHLKQYNSEARYSLIVTLETVDPGIQINLYRAIVNKIPLMIET